MSGEGSGERRVAFVTGASRGIGAAACLALAGAGYDVVVSARTLVEGQSADGRPLPGSIASTAEAVEAAGGRALPLRLDLLDRGSIDAAVVRALEVFGRVDLLLNNGIYTGEGSMQHVLELQPETIRTIFEANVFAPLHLVQRLLPGMLARGSGLVIDMVSGAGLSDPPAPAGQGGWGFAYAATKAALHRLVGVLAVEHRGRGVGFVNVEPGFVMTEAMALNDPGGALSMHHRAAPMSVPAAVIARLAQGDPLAHTGETVQAQRMALAEGLHADWR